MIIELCSFVVAKRSEVFNIYWRIEQKCRKCTKIIAFYPLNLMFLAAALYAIYCISIGNLDTSTWILPYKMCVPFDTRSPLGWFAMWFVQTQTGISYSAVLVTISTYFVCCCFYIVGLCEHFDYLIHSLEENDESNGQAENAIPKEQRIRFMKETLSKAVNIHNTIFE